MKLLSSLRLYALLVIGLSTVQAQATPLAPTVDLDFTGFAVGYRNGTVTSDGSGQRVSAGLFNFAVMDSTGDAPWSWDEEFQAFCVQLGVRLNQDRTTYSLTQAIDYFGDADQVDMIGRLYTGFHSSVTNGLNSAGFQLALWELVEETADHLTLFAQEGPADSFWSTGFNGARNVANQWLAALDDITNEYDLYVLQGDRTQDLLVFSERTPKAVPVPASLGLMGLGLVVLGRRMRRQS